MKSDQQETAISGRTPDGLLIQTIESNAKSIQKFEKLHGNIKHALKQNAFLITDLRNICGFRCAGCNGYPNLSNIEFYNYSPKTLCWECQKRPKYE